MKIDEQSIVGKDRIKVNEVFSEAYNWSVNVTYDDLIDNWMLGPECVELELGGDMWLVCDTDHTVYDEKIDCDIHTGIYYHHNELRDGQLERWICNRPLLQLVLSLSPRDSCQQIQDKMRMDILRRKFIEIGSKPSLDLHMSMLPNCARMDYEIVWIEGDLYGFRSVH